MATTRKASGAANPAPDPSQFHHAMWPRRAKPGQSFDSDALRGPAVHLAADEHGMVRLNAPEEVAFADDLRLPAWPTTSDPTPSAPASGEEA